MKILDGAKKPFCQEVHTPQRFVQLILRVGSKESNIMLHNKIAGYSLHLVNIFISYSCLLAL